MQQLEKELQSITTEFETKQLAFMGDLVKLEDHLSAKESAKNAASSAQSERTR